MLCNIHIHVVSIIQHVMYLLCRYACHYSPYRTVPLPFLFLFQWPCQEWRRWKDSVCHTTCGTATLKPTLMWSDSTNRWWQNPRSEHLWSYETYTCYMSVPWCVPHHILVCTACSSWASIYGCAASILRWLIKTKYTLLLAIKYIIYQTCNATHTISFPWYGVIKTNALQTWATKFK